MFNLWSRTYVQLFSQRTIFDTKSVIADKAWSTVLFPPTMFSDVGGSLLQQEQSLDAVINKHYDGQISNFFSALLGDIADKWSIVVEYDDYHKLLAYYLKELQHTYKFSDADLHLMAYSYLYNNFYYSADQNFVDGFVGQKQQEIMKNIFDTYQSTGILDLVKPADLPTEIGYLLVKRGLVDETELAENFVGVAKMVVNRLWQVHMNDFSEWLVLDTQQFLNMLKCPDTATVLTNEFTFHDMLNFIKSDAHLNAMFFSTASYTNSSSDWDTNPDYLVSASRVISAWKGLAEYLVQRGTDAEWAQLRHNEYAEIALRYDYVNNICDAVSHILGLPGAPETLDRPIVDLLGYDILSESVNSKYNKTLLLLTLREMSPTFRSFIDTAFTE